MAKNRLQQLSGVAASVPGLNQQARGQAQAAQDIMLQRAVGGGGKAQEIATAAATSAGQSAFAQRQKEQGVAAQAVSPQAPQIPFRSAEMEISLKALKSVADTENKIAKFSLGVQ